MRFEALLVGSVVPLVLAFSSDESAPGSSNNGESGKPSRNISAPAAAPSSAPKSGKKSKKGPSKSKQGKSSNTQQFHRLAPFGCTNMCIDSADINPQTGELVHAVRPCSRHGTQGVSQQWIIHENVSGESDYSNGGNSNLIKIESGYHSGKCISVDYERGDQLHEVKEACINGVLALLPCKDNPAANWYFTGGQLQSSFCWMTAGVSSMMHVEYDKEHGRCNEALQAYSHQYNIELHSQQLPPHHHLQSDSINTSSSISNTFMLFVDNPATYKPDIDFAREEVERIIEESERELIPKFMRLGFHDCIGGCDGCVDLDVLDNRGLEEPIDALVDAVDKFQGSSIGRADIWALATLVSADMALIDPDRPEGIHFPMNNIGRKDCQGADARGVGGPNITMPSNDLTTRELLEFFNDEFDFTAEEVVSIMGAHSVAVATRENTGFGNLGKEEGWVFEAEEYILDNRYYAMLLGDDNSNNNERSNIDNLVKSAPMWQLELVHNNGLDGGIPDRYQWFHKREGEEERPIMTNSDMALVRDLSGHISTDEKGNAGKVDCVFEDHSREGNTSDFHRKRSTVVCPVASDTIEKMVEYKLDNNLFLYDFEKVLGKMVRNGY